MDLREFYKSIGGNYEDAILRLGNEERIVKYLNMFLNDKNFEMLKSSLEVDDYENAFLAAHTLKGIALNLNFGNFAALSSGITELLRPRKANPDLKAAFMELEKSYNVLVRNIDLAKGSV